MKRREQSGVWRPYHGAVKRYAMPPRTGIRHRFVMLIAFAWMSTCSDIPGPDCCDPTLTDVVVSDPIAAAGLTASATVGPAFLSSNGAEDSVALVSLPPGTAPIGSRDAAIRLVGDGAPIFTTVRDGGFDPVAVAAQPGDTIEIRMTDAGGAALRVLRVPVAARRPPVVVRTGPGRKKTDVPLNSAIVVVFSEPIAEASLSGSSLQLFRGQFPVAGTVRVLQGTGATVAFVPSAPLSRNTDYRLVVSGAVRDLDGDALETGVTVPFQTGQSSTGPAASITVSPDTVYLAGATYQMTATVQDAAGTELIDQPVWSTSDPTGLTVSPSGMLTGLATGTYDVTARSNDVVAGARVHVIAGPPAAVEVMPPEATVGASGDTIILTATVRDSSGRLLHTPSVTWTSSDVAMATVAADSAGSAGLAFATVTGVGPGSVSIIAISGTASATASVTVIPPLPVASLTVSPASAALLVQATKQLSAKVRDPNGKVLAGRAITWTTDNAAVATVDASGLVTGVSAGAAGVTATSEGVSDTGAIAVELPVFALSIVGEGNYEVYVMNADGSAVANLTNNAAYDYVRAWSPDGRKIVFTSRRDGNDEIYVMNADGSAVVNLTNNGAFDLSFGWSPDGQKIGFYSTRDGNGDVYVMNADGSAVANLTNNAALDYAAAWSPDGRKIAFSSRRDGNDEIYVMNADGSAQTRLTNRPSHRDVDPAWSPDGRKIAFVQDDGGEIYVMNADGSAVVNLTNNAAWDGSPAWSPDGQKIAFQSYRDGNPEIYVMNVDGSAVVNLTINALDDASAAWSPDGRKIAFYSNRSSRNFYGDVYVMNADGTNPTRLTNTPAQREEKPLWRP